MSEPAKTVKPAQTVGRIVAAALNNVVWVSDDRAYCQCPGAHQHTNKNSRHDCILYLNGVPTIHCLHSSCRETVKQRSKDLRKALEDSNADGYPKADKDEQKRLAEFRKTTERHRQRAMKSLPRLLKDYAWPYAQIVEDSPVEIPADRTEQTRLFLPHFPADGKIWIGNRFDSGDPSMSQHFKTRDEWLAEASYNKPLICPSLFKADSIARTNDNVTNRPFLVVESDIHSKDQVGAIFKWLRDEVEMDLVAVVDTGGKSLHGWFALPEDTDLTEAQLVLPALGCDPALFTKSQPVRLPGGLREINQPDGSLKYTVQNLIYLKQP